MDSTQTERPYPDSQEIQSKAWQMFDEWVWDQDDDIQDLDILEQIEIYAFQS